MLLTLSNSLLKFVSRAASASYLDSPFRAEFWFSVDGLEGFLLCDLEALEGEANRFSVSEESERWRVSRSGVAMLGFAKWAENVFN